LKQNRINVFFGASGFISIENDILIAVNVTGHGLMKLYSYIVAWERVFQIRINITKAPVPPFKQSISGVK